MPMKNECVEGRQMPGKRHAHGEARGRRLADVRFVVEHLKLNLSSAMEYRFSFVSQVVFMIANNFALLFFWALLFARTSDIGGWAYADVITMYAVCAASYGLSVVLFGNGHRIARLVSEGQLDYYLLMPRDPLLHILISHSDISGLGDMVFAAVVFCLYARPTPGRTILFAALCIAGCAVFTSFGVIIGSLSFFMGNARTISSELTQAMLIFGGYPGPIFKGAVRAILYSLIPVGFMVYLPVEILRQFSPVLVAGEAAFAVGITVLAATVFRVGLSRYESGNLFSARI